MPIRLAAFCEDVVRDSETQSASLIKLIDEMSIEAFPFFIPKLCMFLIADQENGEEDASYEITLTNAGTVITEHTVQVKFIRKSVVRVIIRADGIFLEKPGDLSMSIVSNGKSFIYSCPIRQTASIQQQ